MTIPEVRPYTLPYQPSGGLWFDGKTGYVTSQLQYNTLHTLTLFARINPVKLPAPTKWMGIIGAQDFGELHCGIVVRYNGSMMFRDYANPLGSNLVISPANTVNTNSTQFLAATYDNGDIILYHDGDEVASDTKTKQDTSNITIIGAAVLPGRYMNGLLIEAGVIAEALTQSEIRGLMEGRRLPTEWDCRLWLDFRQGHTRDLSGNGNHGTLYGGAYFV